MKDRIRQIMESQHMTQQVFAQFIDVSPATLSSIFSGRTKPTLNIFEALRKKFPDISRELLMFGTGSMRASSTTQQPPSSESSQPSLAASPTTPISTNQMTSRGGMPQESILDFGTEGYSLPEKNPRVGAYTNSVKSTHPEIVREEVKYIDKPQRRVIEIRVFYDDQTWDTFVLAKK